MMPCVACCVIAAFCIGGLAAIGAFKALEVWRDYRFRAGIEAANAAARDEHAADGFRAIEETVH